MVGRYAYSFDRESFRGVFESRTEALRAAQERALDMTEPPSAIYVGQTVAPDVHADGHAEALVESMRRHVRDDADEPQLDFLAQVGEHELAELDTEVARVITAWLDKHDLRPRHFKLIGISEYAVPLAHARSYGNWRDNDEVSQLGPGDES